MTEERGPDVLTLFPTFYDPSASCNPLSKSKISNRDNTIVKRRHDVLTLSTTSYDLSGTRNVSSKVEMSQFSHSWNGRVKVH